ncbi:tyrosine-type recombinase/integrase [Chryseobacterium sp.]|uniref:tyrosine-type recombinase/integrase n=1 Tax=Chryseobacterium sp. TaxID=1871047 RepID=UPI00262AB4AF|nr:tyrosine-type recombinase/integrase [Chryseobacterium sp.]
MKKERTKLLHGCSRTNVFVSPAGYKKFTSKSKFPRQWRVKCIFYDPLHADRYPDGFQFVKKFSGESLTYLKEEAELQLEIMVHMLDKKNYNPITHKYMPKKIAKLHPNLPIIDALKKAHENKSSKWTPGYANDVLRLVNDIDKILIEVELKDLLIGDVETWHIKTILDHLNLTDSVFNHSRSHLQSLFKELKQFGCTGKENPVNDVEKRVEEIRIREVITLEDMMCVHKYLQTKCYTFFRYGKIFFYAAGRSTEFMQLQKKHVDLENQEYQILIKKGKQYTWETKVILRAAIPYWREILAECEDEDDYLFSAGLVPGEKPISAKQISRRWKRHVKDSDDIKDAEGNTLKVTADFYTHKHLFIDILDEMSENKLKEIEAPAQRMANHSKDSTTGIYATKRTKRKNKDLKEIIIENT